MRVGAGAGTEAGCGYVPDIPWKNLLAGRIRRKKKQKDPNVDDR
jgi:hypothetical protein